MAAITWRNISGPSLGESSDILTAAGTSFNRGLGTLDNLLKQREAVQAKNWEAEKQNNTQAYLDRMASAKTPEELAALEGELGQMAAGFNGQVDRDKVRGAMASQLNTLRQQQMAGLQHGDVMLARERKPALEQAQVLRAQGRFEEAEALLASGDFGGGEAEIYTGMRTDKRAKLEQDRADAMFPITRNNAIKQGQLTGIQLDAATREANDAAKVKSVIDARLPSFNAETERHAKGIAAAARKHNIPLDEYDVPNVEAAELTTAQLAAFQKDVQGLGPAPTGSAYLKQVRDDLIRAGVSANALAAGEAQGNSVFKAKGVLSTEDQAALAEKSASVDASEEKARKENLFYTPPNEYVQAKTDVLTKVETLIKDSGGTKTRLRKKMSSWMDDGLEIVRAGEKVKVRVPPKVVEAAMIGGLESDVYFFQRNQTDDNMEEIIRKLMASPEYNDQRTNAEFFMKGGHIQMKRDFAKDIGRQAGAANPADTLKALDEELKYRASKVK